MLYYDKSNSRMLKELKGVGSTHRINARRRRGHLLRTVIGIIVVIVIICTALGFAYVWYLGKTKPVQQAAEIKHVSTAPATAVSAPVVDENAPVGVAIQSFSSSVQRGTNASIGIRTRPQAACSIRVTYSQTPDQAKESKDGGLIPKTADEYGSVSWTWSVEADRPVGSWPVEVTCAYKAKWGYGKDMLQVID